MWNKDSRPLAEEKARAFLKSFKLTSSGRIAYKPSAKSKMCYLEPDSYLYKMIYNAQYACEYLLAVKD